MYKLLKAIFKDFKVDGKTIPSAFLDYRGNEEDYIIWQTNTTEPSFYAENELWFAESEIMVTVYSKISFLRMFEEVKKTMKNNGFIWIHDGLDMIDDDTKLYYKTSYFIKEKNQEENND